MQLSKEDSTLIRDINDLEDRAAMIHDDLYLVIDNIECGNTDEAIESIDAIVAHLNAFKSYARMKGN